MSKANSDKKNAKPQKPTVNPAAPPTPPVDPAATPTPPVDPAAPPTPPADPSAPATDEASGNSMKIVDPVQDLPNTVENNPTYVYSEVEGQRRKFLIRGKHFSIPVDGHMRDFTDTDLAHPDNQVLIDQWAASGNGILREVFE